MVEYKWPEAGERRTIGTSVSRIDGPEKVTGRARYAADVKRPGMLHGAILRSPYAHSRITSIDASAAERLPGVAAIHVIQKPGTEVFWAGDEIVAVAAVDERTAQDALAAIRVEYEKLPHNVRDDDPSVGPELLKPVAEQKKGDPEQALASAEVTLEGRYGLSVITHACMETHGSVCEWEGKNLTMHVSTQGVASIPSGAAAPLGIAAGDVRVKQEHIGGAFGSKFGPDRWDVVAAELARKAGKPVRMKLDRAAEQAVAGSRPSLYARVKLGATRDGRITAWDSESWGTTGVGGTGNQPIPYVFAVPNQRVRHNSIVNHIGPTRAWRAPLHPQACYVTMCAIDDLAAKLGLDPLEVFLKNLDITGARADNYREELGIAADLAGWKKKWHPRGDTTAGAIKRGFGLSIHTWGGRGHRSNGDITVQPDGSVEIRMATQDLGTGTRTALAIVLADAFGLPIDAIRVRIGDSSYPTSGGSGGSSTIGGISSAARRGALDILDQLFQKVAPALGVPPADLEAAGGRVRVKSDPGKGLSWAEACAKLGATPLTVRGVNPGPSGTPDLTTGGVGGAQIAEVAVDVETGIVRVERLVAAQDCGLIINRKLAESQCRGAMIMGISYSLYEEKIMDETLGRMLNPNLESYKLARIGDIGELVVHMMTGKGYDERGVIGLGEPPTISPGPAISNAVANAIGVRVSTLPLTPARVLAALERKGA